MELALRPFNKEISRDIEWIIPTDPETFQIFPELLPTWANLTQLQRLAYSAQHFYHDQPWSLNRISELTGTKLSSVKQAYNTANRKMNFAAKHSLLEREARDQQ